MIDTREIRHFHMCCSIGAGAKGFNRGTARVGNMQAKWRCIGGTDVVPSVIRDFKRQTGAEGTVMDLFTHEQYVAFHGKLPPPGWREALPEDIHRACGYERPHVVFMSAPCLPADGLVVTEHGPRAINTIRAGDKVLTHKGRMREVTHVGTHRYTGAMHGFRLNGTVDTQWFTDEHPLWVRRVERPVATGKVRRLGEAVFVQAKDVRVGDRIGFPVEPELRGSAARYVRSFGNPQAVIRGGHAQGRYAKSEHVAIVERVRDLTTLAEDPNLWFLIGCYLGDGYRGTGDRYEVSYCVGATDGDLARRVRTAVAVLGLPCREDASGGSSNIKLRVRSRHLHMICGGFGDGAAAKAIPPELMGLEDELLDYLIDGYRSTDGSAEGARLMKSGSTLQARWKIPSVSLQLLRDIQRLLLRQGVFASIHKCWPGGPQTIMGRAVQTKPRWELNVRLDPIKRTCFEFIDDAVWVRVREATRRDADESVWNLSVAEDDTYCAPMIATHNCKGFSGLLSSERSLSGKYQALNQLALRSVWLVLEAFKDDPPEFLLFENVPRVATRGRALLDQIESLLKHYGYASAETTHCCGKLGGLAQKRQRFLLVARHIAKVPPFLYEPRQHPLRAVGDVLGKMFLPGDPAGGPMHRIPQLHWRTWVRLAFVEAGKDWRSLQRLSVENGFLKDFAIAPGADYHSGVYGVRRWEDTSGTVCGEASPSNGAFSIADPRFEAGDYASSQFGVTDWKESANTVTGQRSPGQGKYSVADPRIDGHEKSVQMGVRRWDQPAGTVTASMWAGTGPNSVADPRVDGVRHNNVFRVVRWDESSPSVTGGTGPTAGGLAVSDPRTTYGPNSHRNKLAVVSFDKPAGTVTGATQVQGGGLSVADPRPSNGWEGGGKYRVSQFDEPAGTVIAESHTGNGAFAVADPRPGLERNRGDDYLTAGHYGVIPWGEPSGAVTSNMSHDNGRGNVADPRLPLPTDRLVAVIRSYDGTWHRPFTTLELAALQSLYDPEEDAGIFTLEGTSDSAWREHIGNAVPPATAQAIADVIGHALLLAWAGETFALGSTPIWVRPIAIALSVKQEGPQQ